MQDMTFDTILAVFEEMFGPLLFWALVTVAAIITIAFVYVLIRDHNVESSRFLRAELTAPLGAIAAILFVQWITNSGFRDVGGPIDWIVLLLIGLAGAGGLMILVYTGLALFARKKTA
jgi:drug/metabolite transporter (DMT)-like permease